MSYIILRMIFSFLFVVYHLHSKKKKSNTLKFSLYFLGFYTSTFFLISFYFSFRSLSSKNNIMIKERLKRIIFPYIIWPLIIFFGKNIFIYINSHHFLYSIKDLFLQLVVGRTINDVFWFQFNLIFISIIIIIISSFFSRKISFCIFSYIILFSIYFNFKGIDKKIFSEYNMRISHSVGRLSYSIIYSLTGYFLGSFNLLGIIKQRHKKRILLLSPFFFFILKEHRKLINFFHKFHFIVLDILITFLFLFFISFHLDSIISIKFMMIVKRITSFTGGVYYLHIFIFDIFHPFACLISNRDVKSCITIYIICYVICLIFSNIFKKSIIKYLFY